MVKVAAIAGIPAVRSSKFETPHPKPHVLSILRIPTVGTTCIGMGPVAVVLGFCASAIGLPQARL